LPFEEASYNNGIQTHNVSIITDANAPPSDELQDPPGVFELTYTRPVIVLPGLEKK